MISKNTIPEYIVSNPKKFDLIFIDGGHDLETAESDLFNCKDLSHNDTIVIMDDTVLRKINGIRMEPWTYKCLAKSN